MTNNIKKHLLFAAAALTFSFAAEGQSLQEGIKMVQYERYGAAKGILQPMAASNAIANYYLGITELEQGNTEAARGIFAKYPDDAANIAGMARIQYATGNSTEGLRLAQMAAGKAKKKDWEPFLYAADAINYGDTSQNQEALQQAVTWYKAGLEKNDNVNLRIGLGDAYRKIPGSGGVAMTNYQAAVAKDPKNSLGYYRIGRLWYATRQNYQDALDNFNNAKQADSMNPLPYRYLAEVYNRLGKPEQANENVDKYYELSDKSVEDKILRANVKFGSKDYAAAMATGQELLNQGVKKPSLYRLLGWSQYENKDYAGAQKSIQTFFATEDPKNFIDLDYMYAARTFLQQHQFDSAQSYFERAVQADTVDKLKTYKTITEEYQAFKGDTAYANTGYWFGRYAKENPNAKATDYFNWGKYAYYGKKYDSAAQAYQQLQTRYADNASAVSSALYWQGRVAAAKDPQAKSTDAEAAVKFYQQWLAMEGDKPAADLNFAYQYITYYYYNKDDKANAIKYADLVLTVEPGNKFATDIKAALSKQTSKPK